jgi:hypothetical protein
LPDFFPPVFEDEEEEEEDGKDEADGERPSIASARSRSD